MTPDAIEQGLWQFFFHLVAYLGIGLLAVSFICVAIEEFTEWMINRKN